MDLAHEYAVLGKTKRATSIFAQALNVVRSGKASDEACASFFLRFAESLAIAEDVTRRYVKNDFYSFVILSTPVQTSTVRRWFSLTGLTLRIRRVQWSSVSTPGSSGLRGQRLLLGSLL